jgi:hypothetical protein
LFASFNDTLKQLAYAFETIDLLTVETKPEDESLATLESDWYSAETEQLWSAGAKLCAAVAALLSFESLTGLNDVDGSLEQINDALQQAYASVARTAALRRDNAELAAPDEEEPITIGGMIKSGAKAFASKVSTSGPRARGKSPSVSRGQSPERTEDREVLLLRNRRAVQLEPATVVKATSAINGRLLATRLYTIGIQLLLYLFRNLVEMRSSATWHQDAQAATNLTVQTVSSSVGAMTTPVVGSALYAAYEYAIWPIIGYGGSRPFWDNWLHTIRWFFLKLGVDLAGRGFTWLLDLFTYSPTLFVVFSFLMQAFDVSAVDAVTLVRNIPAAAGKLANRLAIVAAERLASRAIAALGADAATVVDGDKVDQFQPPSPPTRRRSRLPAVAASTTTTTVDRRSTFEVLRDLGGVRATKRETTINYSLLPPSPPLPPSQSRSLSPPLPPEKQQNSRRENPNKADGVRTRSSRFANMPPQPAT